MVFFIASDAALVGVTRITSNCVLMKSFMLCSAFVLVLLIFVGGRLKSLSVTVCLYLETYLILKSNSRIQASYLVINISGRSVSDLLS